MTRVLFICHSNICRSPMAECIFRHFNDISDFGEYLEADSAAVSREEIGSTISFRSKAVLMQHNIPVSRHYARLISADDIDNFDYIIAMDRYNLEILEQLFGTKAIKKAHLLMDFTDRPGEVADPWYTRDYEAAFQDIYKGCDALYLYLLEKHVFLQE